MPSAPIPEVTPDWWKVFGAAFALAAVALMGWFKSYVEGKKESPTATGELAGKAVGVALVDKTTADAVTAIADDFHELREIAERWETRVNQETAAELAELRMRKAKEAT